MLGAHTGVLGEHTQDNGQRGAVDGSSGHGHTREDHDDQQDNGYQAVDTGQDGRALVFQRVIGSGHLLFLGQQMDQNEHRAEIGHGGQDGGGGDVHVGNADHLRHDKGARAHDGGHDLSAGGGHGLHGTGLLGGVAGLFHQGNGQNAGGGHVGHGGAGDHAKQTGGEDRRLGGASGGFVAELHARVNQHAASAAVGEEGAEHHEVEQRAHGGGQRRTKDAVLAQHEGFAELGEVHAREAEDAADVLAEKGVGHKEENDDKQRQGNHPPDRLHQHEQQQHGHGDVQRGHGVHVINPQVQRVGVGKEVPADEQGGSD